MKRILAASLLISFSSLIAFGQTESRSDVLRNIEAKRAELAKLEKEFLAPSAEDRAEYAEFLTQPNTGLTRLLPREKFDFYANKKSGMTVRGGGAYYSFTQQSHEFGNSTQIGFQNGSLDASLGGASYGMLTKLEGARLEDVSTELPGVIFLAKYSAVTNEPDARVEQRRFSAGTTIDGISYKRALPAEIGAIYLLRSINFDDSDVLVTFRVVRQDTDGSVIIAWKILEKYATPKLAMNK
jgi:hypothetical protein